MRISTSQFYESTAANYQKNFAKVVKTSEEASSLVRVNTAADDPVGASRLLQLGNQASMLSQYEANVTTIKATLGTTEAVMTSIGNVLQRAKELAVSAGNAAYTDADRQAVASELGSIEDQLLSLMNTKDETANTSLPAPRAMSYRSPATMTAPTATTATRSPWTCRLATPCRWPPTALAGKCSSKRSTPVAPKSP